MGYQDTMQVCKKHGHQINDMTERFPSHNQNFCSVCGSETTIICSNCRSKIKGCYHVEGFIGHIETKVPLNCHNCGKAYPWRNKLLLKRAGKSLINPFKSSLNFLASLVKKWLI
ncbi:MAG: DUF2321 domain-containing protein [Candidatus Magasanikbacteria bacterium]